MKIKILTLLFILLWASNSLSATQDTLWVKSTKMQKEIGVIVVAPENKNNTRLPVLYLLHGYGGGYGDWASHMDLKPLAEKYQTIIVCPDGSKASWYLDSPEVAKSQYETFTIKELIPEIDKQFPTQNEKSGRYITGLSMGGHGALYLAIRHAQLFKGAGSMSGVVYLPNSSVKKELAVKLGAYKKYPQRWEENSIVNMIEALKKVKLALIVECGVDDYFYKDNLRLHNLLLKAKIDHEYWERPGKHNWDYWTNALEYHLLYFSRQ